MSSNVEVARPRTLGSLALAALVLATGCQAGGRASSPTTSTVAPAVTAKAPSPSTSSPAPAPTTSPAPTSSPSPSSGAAPWQPTSLTSSSAWAIAVDPLTPANVYAASSQGLEKTGDGGATWALVFTVATNAVALDPSTSGTVYAATASGVSKSTDGGATWSSTGAGVGVTTLAVDSSSPSTLYAGTGTGAILKTTDGGATWATLTTGITSVIASLAVDPVTPSNVYAATGGTGAAGQFQPMTATGPGGLFKSSDGGATWLDLRNGFSSTFNVVAIDPATPTTVYAGSYALQNANSNLGTAGLLVQSLDGGSTWTRLSSFPSAHIYGLAIDPSAPSTLYTCGLGGVLKSTDGGATWADAGNGLMPANIGGIPESWAIAIDPTAPLVLYASALTGVDGVFKTTTGGQ